MYTLHYVPDWASFVVHIVLEELGVPYTLARVDWEAGALDSAAHRARQPFGLIPALDTPDGPMFETAAILLWLAERHGRLAPAPGTPERAAFLPWFTFVNNEIHTRAMELIHPERAAGEAVMHAASEASRARMHAGLVALDAMVARARPGWLSPDQPGILGYYLAMLMRWLSYAQLPEHVIDTRDFPALQAILRAMEATPAAIRAATTEGIAGAGMAATFFSNPKG